MSKFRRFRQLHHAQRSPIDLGEMVSQNPPDEAGRASRGWVRAVSAVAAALVVGLVGVAIVWVAMPEPAPTREVAIDTPPPPLSSAPTTDTSTGAIDESVPETRPNPAEVPEATGPAWETRPLMPARPVRSRSFSLTTPPPSTRGGFTLPSRRLP